MVVLHTDSSPRPKLPAAMEQRHVSAECICSKMGKNTSVQMVSIKF